MNQQFNQQLIETKAKTESGGPTKLHKVWKNKTLVCRKETTIEFNKELMCWEGSNNIRGTIGPVADQGKDKEKDKDYQKKRS